jgi:hypothetical protein
MYSIKATFSLLAAEGFLALIGFSFRSPHSWHSIRLYREIGDRMPGRDGRRLESLPKGLGGRIESLCPRVCILILFSPYRGGEGLHI